MDSEPIGEMKNHRPTTILVKDPTKESTPLGKLATVLDKLSECRPIDSTKAPNTASLQEALGTPSQGTIVFIESSWITQNKVSFEQAWQEWSVVIVETEPSVGGAALAEWQRNASFLALHQIANTELPRIIQLTLAANRYPGVAILGDKGSEVFFEKVLSLGEVGQKVDRIQIMLEKQHPKLSQQFFNFRQLSYSVLYQGFLTSSSASKFLPAVDFQCLANSERLAFAARFKAPEGSLAKWKEEILGQKNLLWRNLYLSAEVLVLTEIKNLKEMEIKALLSREGDFSGTKAKSLLSRSISSFRTEGAPEEEQKAAKFLPLDVLTSEAKKASPEALADLAAAGNTFDSEATLLQLKLKTEMLEKENLSLQELIKKKTQLIAGLNKNVNRAQSVALQGQNGQVRELQMARLSEEKTKGELQEVTKKLRQLQQKMAEGANSAPVTSGPVAPKQDFEKDWKQADYAHRQAEAKLGEFTAKFAHQEGIITNLRKENREQSVNINDMKAMILKLEKKLTQKEREEEARKLVVAPVIAPVAPVAAGSAVSDKLKEATKLLQESQAKEQAHEKEAKRLSMKLEAMEMNAKAQLVAQKKQAETAEKAVEEAKRQKSEAMRKLEEREAASKKKLEETNDVERKLKAKIEELTAALNGAKKKAA